MPPKYAVYHSDRYYPSVDLFDNKQEAEAEWELLIKQRKEYADYTDGLYTNGFGTDFICEIISANRVGNADD